MASDSDRLRHEDGVEAVARIAYAYATGSDFMRVPAKSKNLWLEHARDMLRAYKSAATSTGGAG